MEHDASQLTNHNTDHGLVALFTPATIPLYQAVEARILSLVPAEVEVRKTQVSFRHGTCFAWVWPPIRPMKGRPDRYVVLTLSLGRQIEHARILESLEPYPGRWTHHLLIQSADDLDETLDGWIRDAADFARQRAARRHRNRQAD